MTIEEIKATEHSKDTLEAEKHARDLQVEALRAEMLEIRQRLERHYVAEAGHGGNLSKTQVLDLGVRI